MNKYSMLIISLFIAILLWIYVANLQQLPQELEFRVSLQPTGLPAEMIIEALPERVNVRVHGGDVKIAGLNAGDFTAVVDFAGVTVGENNLPVNVTAPPGVQITKIIPEAVQVIVDTMAQKQVPVQVFLRGTPQPGYSAGEPVLVPTAVLARGPSQLLATIEQVPLIVNVDGVSQNLDLSLPVSAPHEQIKLSPEIVRVVVPVNITVPYKTVPVRVNTTGMPAEGYEVTETLIQPLVVQVFAPAEVLDQINEVSTQIINITGIEETWQRQLELKLPPEVILLQPGSVEITVTVEKSPPVETPAEPEPENRP
ncbi:MAG: hypothetical protein LRZ99_06320 [Desulfotomaculum sp.]|nr:hypothetical protein [Desulfotomaculum sp.]